MTSASEAAIAGGATGDPHAGAAHVVPFKILAVVLGALLALTWLTVAATWIEMGSVNLWLALAIATLKASLIVLYFMHLRYDSPLYAIVFITALLFVALFVGLALLDTRAYQPDLIPGYGPGMAR